MSVAVSCNLSDGVVLAADSAVALRTAGEIVKIYEPAEKLFPLGDRPIGMAVYGLAALGNRSIGSYLREFAADNPVADNPVAADPCASLEQVRPMPIEEEDLYRSSSFRSHGEDYYERADPRIGISEPPKHTLWETIEDWRESIANGGRPD